MTISVSGLGSGLDYESWIEDLVAVKQADIDKVSKQVKNVTSAEDTLSSIKSSYQKLLDSIEVFTKSLSNEDVFNQRTTTSTSDAVTATASSKTELQDVSVTVSQLATATTAESTSTVASYVDSNTKLSEISKGAFKEGTFSIYVNGQKNTITLTSDMTMQNVLDTINLSGGEDTTGIAGVTATLSADGKLSITESEGYESNTLTVGSSSDTSNFSKVMSLTRSTSIDPETEEEIVTYSSSKALFDTNTSATLTSTSFALGSVTAGTFTIGDKEFTIDANTTLDKLISNINSSNCGATAAWDPNSGKFKLTADDEGAVNINVEAGSSNFTNIMGLTSAGKLATGSQTLGTNAILNINGTTITSSSNKVTSDVSGITGLTLELKAKTTSTATISVEQDTTEIEDALTNVVSAYNMAITATEDATTTDGDLYGETVLNSIRSNIRKLFTASVDGDEGYKTLASIGITTGAFSTDTSADTTQLKLDSTKLQEALKNNPDAVKKLLIGEGTTEGVFDKVETVLDNSLNATKGYFVNREKTYDKQISRLNDKVEDMTADLEDYEARLKAKFEAMDKLISSLQNQASIFDSYFNKDNSSDS